MPSPAEVRALFRAFLREGNKFPQYNVREYVKRRAREDFRAQSQTTDASAADSVWQKAKEELEVVKRQAIVYSLYARKHKSIMEVGDQK